ncbi:glycoside hydrolase 5 family protein [Flaviaesturariibacter terrae]
MRYPGLVGLLAFLYLFPTAAAGQSFVQVRNGQFRLNGQPYYYVGTNYWYGSLLALGKDRAKGIGRLRRELDFLQRHGVTNLRVLAGAEGSGLINGVPRVGPPLQPEQGLFDTSVLRGLDLLLAEMGKRRMKAVVILSNNWEWSGGFLQYLNWNGLLPDSILRRKLWWDEFQDYISRFYSCAPCTTAYRQQVALLLARRNGVTGRRYTDDPTIMAWELANEPRPMRPSAHAAYAAWISATAAFIKERAPKQLVCLGHEGSIGTQSIALYESIHRDRNVDYLTIHIWPKNWAWLRADSMATDFPAAAQKTTDYIREHRALAEAIGKPLVIEEFGLPRDGGAFSPASGSGFRDRYYRLVFNEWSGSRRRGGVIAGVNFWAFSGSGRPVPGQTFWKPGDDYLGDPPMEEQGLYGVFDSDRSTWDLISTFARPQRSRVAPQ